MRGMNEYLVWVDDCSGFDEDLQKILLKTKPKPTYKALTKRRKAASCARKARRNSR